MEVDAPSASIGDLPTELHEQIIGYLPWHDQLNCEHVCKVWREIIRGRHTAGRYSIAPWLPVQNYDLAFYDPLQIHSLLVEGKTLTFKCSDKYSLLGSSYIVDEYLINEIAGGLDEGEAIETVQCITSLDITDKIEQQQAPAEGSSDGSSSSQQSAAPAPPPPVRAPIANLSVLNDMVVLPSLVYEDQIAKLHARFTLMGDVDTEIPIVEENSQSENTAGESSQEGTQESTQEGTQEATQEGTQEGTAAQETTTTQPPIPTKIVTTRMAISSGNFVCDVVKDTGDTYSCLTLGKLLLEIRYYLIKDVCDREKLLDGDESDSDSESEDEGDASDPQPQEAVDPEVLVAQQIAKTERKKALENAEIIVEGLHFVRGAGNQALTIVFNGELVTEGSKEVKV
ncbi:hypothetical protein TWF696_000395 [Orbilia brochopaga]|uniref:F-box domain-containing protein n=1 Tax=Orbilia brochopaga TaxID=3140254 RepID=A0AAV9VDL2_9PEZI